MAPIEKSSHVGKMVKDWKSLLEKDADLRRFFGG